MIKVIRNLEIIKAIRNIAVLVVGVIALGQAEQLHAADANPPDRMTYQGYLVDGNGLPLGNSVPKNYDVVFRIYNSKQGGVALWAEQQTVTVDKGYFSVLLGEGSSTASGEPRGNLSNAFDGNDASDRYIGITVDTGTGSLEVAPRLRMVSSPYSFTAYQARNVTDGLGNMNLFRDVDGDSSSLKLGAGSSPTLSLPESGGAFLLGKLELDLTSYGTGLQIDNGSLSTTFGSQDSSFFHFQTTLPQFYFNKTVSVNGDIRSYNRDTVLGPTNNTDNNLKISSSNDSVIANTDEFIIQGDSKKLQTKFSNDKVELHTDASSVFLNKKLSVNGVIEASSASFSGNLSIIRPDSSEAVLSLHGSSQGTGRIYVGQSATYGGGLIYNGDGSPVFSGSSTDYISFYRTANNVHHEVFKYPVGGNDVTFSGWIGRSAHNSGALLGSYNNVGGNGSQSNPIYTIGSAYKPGQSDLENMYGIGFTSASSNFITGNASGWGLYVASDGDARTFLSAGGGGVSYINRNGGKLGIGTDSPSSPLHIISSQALGGDFVLLSLSASGSKWDITIDNEGGTADDDLTFVYNGNTEGWMDPQSNAWKVPSDRRLKKNIKPYKNNILDGLGRISVYTYNMNNDLDGAPVQIGVMAQDIQNEFPELIEAEDNLLGLDYGRLSVLAIPAINELRSEKNIENQALKNENELLKKSVESLSSQINELQNQIKSNSDLENRISKLENILKEIQGGQ